MKLTAVLIALLAAFPCALSAQNTSGTFFMTGNRLYPECSGNRPFVTGYVMGIFDYSQWAYELSSSEDFQLCTQANVTGNQFGDITCQFLESNPQLRHHAASSIVELAIRGAFPCQ